MLCCCRHLLNVSTFFLILVRKDVVNNANIHFLFEYTSLLLISVLCMHSMFSLYLILCLTERVQSSARGSKVRQDGSGKSSPTEESCTRCCWKGEMSSNKRKKRRGLGHGTLKGVHLNFRVFAICCCLKTWAV